MPGQASVTVAVSSQKSFVLKKIRNIPPPNILADQDDGKKHKTCQYVDQIGDRSLCSSCVFVVVHLASTSTAAAFIASSKEQKVPLEKVLVY